jgi:hypothetical protein
MADRGRVEKLVGMLGSSFDGERANAAGMLQKMADADKVSLLELLSRTLGSGASPPQIIYRDRVVEKPVYVEKVVYKDRIIYRDAPREDNSRPSYVPRKRSTTWRRPSRTSVPLPGSLSPARRGSRRLRRHGRTKRT